MNGSRIERAHLVRKSDGWQRPLAAMLEIVCEHVRWATGSFTGVDGLGGDTVVVLEVLLFGMGAPLEVAPTLTLVPPLEVVPPLMVEKLFKLKLEVQACFWLLCSW